MSGFVSRKAQYQSAYSCTGAKAGTVAMLACTNMPYRCSPNQPGAVAPTRGRVPSLPMPNRGDRVVITNRRARYDYFVLEHYECGIVLKGPEVKSIRNGRANLQDGYARIDDGEVWLFGMHVSPYEFSRGDLDPVRPRKLLLHHKQIVELARATEERGVTLVPLSVYFKDGRAKVELAIARGKAHYDKRQAIAERDATREAQRDDEGRPRLRPAHAPAQSPGPGCGPGSSISFS